MYHLSKFIVRHLNIVPKCRYYHYSISDMLYRVRLNDMYRVCTPNMETFIGKWIYGVCLSVCAKFNDKVKYIVLFRPNTGYKASVMSMSIEGQLKPQYHIDFDDSGNIFLSRYR